MQFHSHANQTHFHKNGFALRLALKQRHKGTRKWPIECHKTKSRGMTLANHNEHRQYSKPVKTLININDDNHTFLLRQR